MAGALGTHPGGTDHQPDRRRHLDADCRTGAVFELGGFDEDPAINFREDLDLVLRLAARAPTLAVRELLVQVREHSQRATQGIAGAQPFLATAAVYQRLERQLTDPRLQQLARRRGAEHMAEAAAQCLKAGDLAAGTGYFLRSFFDRPFRRQWASALARGLGLRR